MESKNLLKNVTKIMFTFFLISIVFFMGCKKNDTATNAPATSPNPQATQDAATSLGGSLAINNGGVLDQVADLLNTPTSGGILNKAINPDPNEISSVTFSYDSTTHWWTVNIDRTRSGPLWFTHFTREYMHQFVNSSGKPQKEYIDNGDTAYTVHHQIVGGTGVFDTPWLAHLLKGISCQWTGVNTNTPTVTINTTAPYTRSAIDTIFGAAGGIRTLDHTLTVNFINVVGPRGTGLQWWLKTAGTLTGHYHAVVTFEKGTTYNEHTIDRDFTVALGGTHLIITTGGKTFQADPETGAIQ